jgi:hypothetical protein
MTVIPAVKAALVTLATATLPASQVIYGPITAVTTTTGRLVSIGRVIGTRDLDSLSLGSTLERFTVDIAIYVDLPGPDSAVQRMAEEQALSDYEDLVSAVLDDITLGLGNVSALPTGDFELREISDANGRHAAVTFSVSVVAQNVEV